MDAKQRGKLERYCKNSSKFLWGLSRANQKITYPWLRNEGRRLWGPHFDFRDGSYANVTHQLLESPGIEKLLHDLIVPRVKSLFSDEALQFLHTCWEASTLPSISFLRKFNIQDAYPFLEINSQFNYVERWGEFAGLWFEEIKEQQ